MGCRRRGAGSLTVRPFQALRMRSAVAAPSLLTAIRDTKIVYVNNANSCIVPLPSGSIATDTIVVFAAHYWGATSITHGGGSSGTFVNLTGSFYNGVTYLVDLTSTDIATGSVTVNFAGIGYGHVVCVGLINGGTRAYRDAQGTRTSTGAASRTVSTTSAPQAGDLKLLFGSCRGGTGASSSDLSLTLATDAQANANTICRAGIVTASGIQSATVNYAGSPAGDYQAIMVIS